jgi:hypothetical protein
MYHLTQTEDRRLQWRVGFRILHSSVPHLVGRSTQVFYGTSVSEQQQVSLDLRGR